MRDGNSPVDDGPTGIDPAGPLGGTHASNTAEPGSVHVILGSERTRIVLSGEVDADLGADLQEATAEAERAGLPIEVDAHHVTFMDSSGLRALLQAMNNSDHMLIADAEISRASGSARRRRSE